MPQTNSSNAPKDDAHQLGNALHRCVSSSHQDDVAVPEALLAADHQLVRSHWWGKYVSTLSSYGEKFTQHEGWGNNVIDRKTGDKVWEPMPLYTRIGMHLLFVGKLQDEGIPLEIRVLTIALEDGYLEKLFLKESIEQGKHFDSPASVSKIPGFIREYNIPTQDLLITDLGGYKTFNEFFYRKLRPDARPIDQPENNNRITSPADCRAVFFPVDEVTTYWIKGKEFTVGNLIQDDEAANNYSHIAIFRLAPQDYHRFHVPVAAIVGPRKDITGNLYTVNPMAVKEKLDVFTQNKHSILHLQTSFPTPLVFVAIGAMLVGSISFNVSQGQKLQRGDNLGYFAYGGSTVIVLFPREMGMKFDDDLVRNSQSGFETILEVGMGIGVCGAA